MKMVAIGYLEQFDRVIIAIVVIYDGQPIVLLGILHIQLYTAVGRKW